MSEFLDDEKKVKSMFQDIADIKIRMKELEEQLKVKEQIAYAFMDKNKTDKIETDFGKFTRVFYPMWEFSPAVSNLETQVKDLKAKEKEDGIATVKSSRAQLRYTVAKE
jgi:SMC interacting uncharacterized protein involved in chromosome segregation